MKEPNGHNVTLCLILFLWLGATAICSADVLVTKNGDRWAGEITDEGTSYRIVRPNGGRMSIPKNMVREILTSQEVEAEFHDLLEQGDLGDDNVVEDLLEFVDDNGLDEEARQEVLKAAYSERFTAAGGSSAAYGSLAEWCDEHGMMSYAEDCRRKAFQCDFPAKLAAAGSDQERLEKLASECREYRLPEETARCLRGEYERRRTQALTAEDKWELALWCWGWNIDDWRDENQVAAVAEATESEDLPKLAKFLAGMGKDNSSVELMSSCAQTVHDLRLKSAGGDPEALARLAVWCRLYGLDTEAAQAEEAALKGSPDDPKVRDVLGYTHNESTDAWERPPLWSVDVLQSVRAESYTQEWGLDTFELHSPGEDRELAIVQVRFRANSSPVADPTDRLANVRRTDGIVLSAFLMPEEDEEANGPWVVFTSTDVVLVLAEGEDVTPSYTSRPTGPGLDGLPHMSPFLWKAKDKRGAVLKYVRKLRFTAITMRPQRETELGLIFYVPKGTTTASLRFLDAAPIELTLTQEDAEETDPLNR